MSVCESSITNPKKQLEFYKVLSEQLQQENKQLKEIEKEHQKINGELREENKQLKEKMNETLDRNIKYNVEIVDLQQENKQLKEKINTYENPEDLTLMFMYCDEKAKDKIKQLKEVIEEVREVINKMVHYGYAKGVTLYMATTEDSEFGTRAKVLLQILDKATKENK